MNWFARQLYRLEMRNVNLLVVALFSAIVVVTLIVSAVAAQALGDFGSLSAAVWWTVKALLGPDYLDDTQGPVLGGLSLVVVLVGFVCVNAGIVATVVSLVTQRIEAGKRGLGRVPFTKHILILNQNDRLDEVINELGSAEKHVEIAIMVPDDKEMCEAGILRSITPEVESNTTIVCRTGLPQYPEDLDRLNARQARAILVLQTQPTANMVTLKQDMIGLKALMVLGRVVPDSIPLVVELGSRDSLTHIRALISRRNVSFLNGNSLIGWILCHASLEPKRVQIYDELFSRRGNEIYRKRLICPTGVYSREQFMSQYVRTYAGEVPLGTINGKALHLNPDEWTITDDTQFIMLSVDAAEPKQVAVRTPPASARCEPRADQGRAVHILILGANSKLDYLLGGYRSYLLDNEWAKHNVTIDVEVVTEKPTEIAEHVAPGLTVKALVLDYIRHPRRLSVLLTSGDFDAVILLSDETVPQQEQDVNVLAGVVVLNRILEKSPGLTKVPPIIAEVLDPHNESILKEYRVPNVVVSSKLTSHLLARFVEDPVVAPVYEDLLDFRGQEICTKKAVNYFAPGTALQFGDMLAALSQGPEIAIGLIDADGVKLNPAFDQPVLVDEHLRLITVARC